MRILQVIDSLEIGGAEKMSVNFANALASCNHFSGLIATRKEGRLKSQIDEKVHYLFLDKKRVFDFKALLKMRRFCVTNKVEVLHAHSSSFFLACLLKIILPHLKIIWHDHNGVGNIPKKDGTLYIQLMSVFFSGIISVNQQLKYWAKKKLFCKKIIYLPNFTIPSTFSATLKTTTLYGNEGKRILCLANLRYQKNHFLLIEVAKQLKLHFTEWTLHFVGKDFQDDYSSKLKEMVIQHDLLETVYFYGSREDVDHIINQCEIAVFSSNSEGLPVALLEYGLQSKAVLSTKVGEIPMIIQDGENGFLVDVNDSESFYNCLERLITDQLLRKKLGQNLYQVIHENHSKEKVINDYMIWLKEL